MGLDSVELVMAWEESFGITIADAEAANLCTPRHVIDFIYHKLKVTNVPGPGGCLTQRAFYRLRDAFHRAFDIGRKRVWPGTSADGLFPVGKRREQWQSLQAHVGIAFLPNWIFGRLPSSCSTVGGLARRLAAHHPDHLRHPAEPWTRAQVRSLVRELITEQLGIPEFSDDANFVRDLRVG